MSNGSFPSNTVKRQHLFYVAVFALAVVLALAARTVPLTVDHPDFDNPWDHHKYIWMAEHNPVGFHVAPFCWRVVTPALARALPMNTERSFFFVTVVSLWLTGVVLFLLARRFGFDSATALTGMLLFYAMGWITKANLYNFWKPDPLAALITAAAIYCIVARKIVWFTVLLALGTGVKESVLFVAPLFYTLRAAQLRDGPLFVRTVLLALPAVGVLVAIRLLVPGWNDDPAYIAALPETLSQVQLGTNVYDYHSAFRDIGLERVRSFHLSSLLTYTVGTFGVAALVLPVFAMGRSVRLVLRFLPFLVLVYMQPLFATNTERLLVAGFPAVVSVALCGVVALGARSRVAGPFFALLPSALIVLMIAKKGMIVVPYAYEALWVVLFTVLVVAMREIQRT